mmetsp:Transcript_91935/g.259720  ORF Transcript_91935/g.259720 Transcript_91935/m.259720 type:complete len:410 (-) Transcript_91935:155-1384(-)
MGVDDFMDEGPHLIAVFRGRLQSVPRLGQGSAIDVRAEQVLRDASEELGVAKLLGLQLQPALAWPPPHRSAPALVHVLLEPREALQIRGLATLAELTPRRAQLCPPLPIEVLPVVGAVLVRAEVVGPARPLAREPLGVGVATVQHDLLDFRVHQELLGLLLAEGIDLGAHHLEADGARLGQRRAQPRSRRVFKVVPDVCGPAARTHAMHHGLVLHGGLAALHEACQCKELAPRLPFHRVERLPRDPRLTQHRLRQMVQQPRAARALHGENDEVYTLGLGLRIHRLQQAARNLDLRERNRLRRVGADAALLTLRRHRHFPGRRIRCRPGLRLGMHALVSRRRRRCLRSAGARGLRRQHEVPDGSLAGSLAGAALAGRDLQAAPSAQRPKLCRRSRGIGEGTICIYGHAKR